MAQARFLAVRPGRIHDAGGRGVPLAHLAYRVGEGPHLFRAGGPVTPHGGWMVMDCPQYAGGGEARQLCQELVRECAARRFTGVVCDFRGAYRRGLEGVCAQVAETCAGRGMVCCVREEYGLAAPSARVLLPTALSGGSLEERLRQATEKFGRRLCLWVERAAEDFLLPSPTGSGRKLTREELERLRSERGGSVFFDHDLCAHYFTYMAGGEGHFVLFDDAGSIRKKLALAQELGVESAILPFDQVDDILGELLE